MNKKLHFNNDGTFKIVQFTDVHWQNGKPEDLRTSELMEMIIREEKPDFVIFTGDTVYGDENNKYLDKALEPVNNAGIPWATVFGNHDSEWGAGKKELLEIQKKSTHCLTEAGDSNISGLGNYYLTIREKENDKPAWIMYFLDSGCLNANKKVEGYDFIKRDQINWYVKQSISLRNDFGQLPALCFFHIPLPEYNDVWDFNKCYGEKNENICCPNQNSGFFSAMVEMGDVKGVFVGHDHINDYHGELNGIQLCYGRATGYNTYTKDGFSHGARIILVKKNKKDFKSWLRLDDGTIVRNQPLHKPEGRIYKND
ncbi:metallophosphoesterase family protein [Vallitalea sediminicola]